MLPWPIPAIRWRRPKPVANHTKTPRRMVARIAPTSEPRIQAMVWPGWRAGSRICGDSSGGRISIWVFGREIQFRTELLEMQAFVLAGVIGQGWLAYRAGRLGRSSAAPLQLTRIAGLLGHQDGVDYVDYAVAAVDVGFGNGCVVNHDHDV